MANSTATFTINPYPNGVDNTFDTVHIFGSIAIGAGNYPANGIPLSLVGPSVYTSNPPFFANIFSASSGYVYRFDPVHRTVRIFEAPASGPNPLSELTASAATPAGVTGDTIYIEAVLIRS